MPFHLRDRKARAPRGRVTAESGEFYPNEVVRILRLQDIDYRQLRRIFRLVRPDLKDQRGWARFSFRDLLAVRMAVRLAGGREALAAGRRLALKPLEEACLVLRKTHCVENPLTDVALRREGKRFVATVSGIEFEPGSGQVVLTTLVRSVRAHLAGCGTPRWLAAEIVNRGQKDLAKTSGSRAIRGRAAAILLGGGER